MSSLLSFLLLITVIVTVHEYGHYIFARLTGVRVYIFSVGFGRALFKYRSRTTGTEYRFCLIPLGGYVKLADSELQVMGAIDKKTQINEEEDFAKKDFLAKFMILFGGCFANFVLAFIIYFFLGLYGMEEQRALFGEPRPGSLASSAKFSDGDLVLSTNGEPILMMRDMLGYLRLEFGDEDLTFEILNIYSNKKQNIILTKEDLLGSDHFGKTNDLLSSIGFTPWHPKVPPLIGRVFKDSAAERGGMLDGDKIIAIDGEVIDDWQSLVSYIGDNGGRVVTFLINRDGRELSLQVTIGTRERQGAYRGVLGVGAPSSYMQEFQENYFTIVRFGLWESMSRAASKLWYFLKGSFMFILAATRGETSFLSNIEGPIGIAKMSGNFSKNGVASFLEFIAFMSISIGFLNLLPIPILDGGRIVILFVETFIFRRISIRIKKLLYGVGVFMVVFLMLLTIVSDLGKLF